MSAEIINFSAAATASMLRRNAPPSWIGPFLSQMATAAKGQRDLAREAFWQEVATLVRRLPPLAL